jgi:hypothetical protein
LVAALGLIQDIVAALDRASIVAEASLGLLALAYEGVSRRQSWLRVGLFGAALLLAAAEHWATGPGLRAVHERVGRPAAMLPEERPMHREFDRLHRAAAATMSAEIVLCLLALGLRLQLRKVALRGASASPVGLPFGGKE